MFNELLGRRMRICYQPINKSFQETNYHILTIQKYFPDERDSKLTQKTWGILSLSTPAQVKNKKPCKTNVLQGLNSLVLTARLELAQLSPLPPQDSVSTNSTT